MNKAYVQITVLVDGDRVSPEDIASMIERRIPEALDVYLETIDDDLYCYEELQRYDLTRNRGWRG